MGTRARLEENKRLAETLERISKRASVLSRCTDDIDEKSFSDIQISLDLLDKAIDLALINQKKKGKEFISDEAIDKIVNDAIKNPE